MCVPTCLHLSTNITIQVSITSQRDKLWGIHSMGCHSAVNTREPQHHTPTWINVRKTLGNVSKSQDNTPCTLQFLQSWETSKSKPCAIGGNAIEKHKVQWKHWGVQQSAWAAITNTTARADTIEIYVLIVLEVGSPRSRHGQASFPQGLSAGG